MMEGREVHLHLHLWKEASDASEASEAPEYFGLPAPVRPSNTSSQWKRRGIYRMTERDAFMARTRICLNGLERRQNKL